MIFDSLSLLTAPNTPPRWSGSIPFNLHPAGLRRVQTTVPLSQVGESEYEMLDLDLWIDKISISNESTLSLSGVPFSVRSLVKMEKPSVISPDRSVFDDSDSYPQDEEFRFIRAETFGNAVRGIFSRVGWSVKVGSSFIKNLPVVTEAVPVITLNGSLLEQLSALLTLMSPNDLFGQGLQYYVNYFTSQIFIISPKGDSANVISVDINDVKPTSITVDIESLDRPAKIYAQESEGAIFRSENHLDKFRVKVEPYSHETSTTVTEADDDKTEISASVQGVRMSVGGLVLSESNSTQITQSDSAEISISSGIGLGTGVAMENTQISRFVTGKTSDVSTTVEYTYLTGPPYNAGAFYFTQEQTEKNILFSNSLPGSRQQISRQVGGAKINKLNYPSVLYSLDGIRILEKKTVTVESTTKASNYSLSGYQFNFPGAPVEGEAATTNLSEVFTYSDDGDLVGDRARKVVQLGTKYTVTETYRTYTPISEELTSELTYEISSEYNGGFAPQYLTSSSTTNVSTSVSSSKTTGPSPTSVLASTDGTVEVGEKLLVSNTADVEGDLPTGIIYTSVDTLTLLEIESYVKNYFVLSPDNSYIVGFSSNFIDARGIIGGRFKFTGDDIPNRPEAYMLNSSGILEYQQQQTNKALEAMQESSFCVSGVSFEWQGESVPIVSMTLCQLV